MSSVASQSHSPFPARDRKLLVNIKDLNIHVGNEHLLKDVSVAVNHGSFVGIIGESGAGKTTLLRLLARRVRLETIKYTGTGWIHDNVWLIAQENVLYEYDTPWDLVNYIHALRFPDADAATREQECTDALVSVELPKHLWHAVIGSPDSGLSVGSRRLLNVALAVVAHAELILLDEPTTGLDPPTAQQVVSVVRKLCNESCACVCTIHQPNAATFEEFTDVLVMYKGRAFRPEYAPTGVDALDVAAAEVIGNKAVAAAAEALMPGVFLEQPKLSSKHAVRARSGAEEEHMTPAARLLAAAEAGQLLPSVAIDVPTEALVLSGTLPQRRFVSIAAEAVLLTKRAAVRTWRNVFAFRFRLAFTIVIAAMIGMSFFGIAYDDPTSLRDWTGFFFMICGSSFVPLIIAAGFFPDEKASFINEFNQSLRPGMASYMFGRTVLDVILGALLATASFISAGIIGMEGDWAGYYVTVLMQILVSDSLGFLVSIRLPAELTITAVVPGIGFLSALLGATLLSPTGDSAVMYDILKWLSFFKYGTAAIADEQLGLMTGNCTVGLDEGCAFTDAAAARRFMELEGDEFEKSAGFQWLMLGVFFVVLRTAAVVVLVTLVNHGRVLYVSSKRGGVFGYRRPKFIRRFNALRVRKTKADRDGEDVVLSADLTAANPNKRPLVVRSGEVACVLGPTYSGKSLLLHAIAGHMPIVGGADEVDAPAYHIASNGTRVRRAALEHPASVRVGYQHDDFLYGMTVGSILQFNIAVRENRAGRAVPDEDTLAGEAMDVLELVRLHVPRTRPCKALSGGQQRRLSIACQLVHRAPTLVLDEPTSGLDSEMSVAVMTAIIEYARQWRCVVVCTMQQPDARLTSLMDHVIVMSSEKECTAMTYPDGAPEDRQPHWERRVKFAGTLQEARGCSDMTVFAELPREGVTAKDLCGLEPAQTDDEDAYSAAVAVTQFDHDVRNAVASAFAAQWHMFTILLKRNVENRLATPLWFALEILIKFTLMPVVIAILIPRIDDPTYANRLGAFLVSTAAMLFSGTEGPCVVASLERLIYLREARARDYGPIAHTLARWLCELPFDTIGITAGALVLHQAVGYDCAFGTFWAITFVAYQAAVAIGTLCGSLPLPLAVTGGLAALATITFTLGSGVIVTPMQLERTGFMLYMSLCMPLRHVVALWLNAELKDQPAMVRDGVKRAWGFDTPWIDDNGPAWGYLFATAVLYRFAALFVCWLMLRLDKRADTPIDDSRHSQLALPDFEHDLVLATADARGGNRQQAVAPMIAEDTEEVLFGAAVARTPEHVKEYGAARQLAASRVDSS